jgi:uroporphyrinogen decarboxylase
LPVDLGGTATTTITRGAYVQLREHLGLSKNKPTLMSLPSQTVFPDDDFLEYFRVDTRSVVPGTSSDFNLQLSQNDEYEFFYDEYGIGLRRPLSGGLYFDLFYHPLKEKTADEVLQWPLPKGDDPNRFKGLREKCLRLKNSGFPVVLSYSLGRGILHEGTALFGFEDYFCRLVLEPKLIETLNERILKYKIDFYDSLFNETGDLLDIIFELDDLGIQQGPFISPELYRSAIKPFQARLFSEIKKHSSEVKIMYHTCGSVTEFIPDLIEIGVDILNPVQLSAYGMNARYLKQTYGKDICFWGGGIDTQQMLPFGTRKEIKEEIRRHMDIWLPGGGYVFATVHNIQDDVPPENIVALFEAIDEYR